MLAGRLVQTFTMLVTLLLLSGAGAASLHAQASDDDSFVIAVLPFVSADDGKAKDLQEEIIAELDDLGPYTLVTEDEVNDAVEQNGFKPGSPIPDVRTLEIAQSLGAKIVARGTLDRHGNMWAAKSTFVDVATRNTQNLPEVTDSDIDDLGQRLVEAFNARNQADKHIIFGRDYMRSDNHERAISNFEQALEYDPGLALAYFFMGQSYLERDMIDPALVSLEKAIELDPAYINAYHSIGEAYLEKGDTTHARDFFEELIRRKADDCDIQVAYGYVMANQLEEVDRGLAAFEEATTLCPDNAAAHQYLAYALPDDRRDEKIANLKKYLELSAGGATDPEALQFLFGLYFANEQYEEARATADEALAADPGNANLLSSAGYVQYKLGEHRSAIDYYNRALEVNPDLERAYLFRALAYQELGNTVEFAKDLERAGKGQSSAILANIFLKDASDALKGGRYGAALELLGQASRLGGNSCAISYYRGDAYYRMAKALQGEDKSIPQNERSRSLFTTAISHLRNACGTYASYGEGLIGNSNQYIERVDLIIKKLSRQGG